MIDNRQYVVGKFIPFSFETITVNTVIGLTTSILDSSPKPKEAFITVESAQIRFRYDNTDPTSSVGHILNPMDSITIKGYSQMRNIKFIKIGASNGTLQVTYLR